MKPQLRGAALLLTIVLTGCTTPFQDGNKALAAGDFESARQLYYKAINRHESEAASWNNIGVTYRRQGNTADAIKAYTWAARYGSPEARKNLAQLKVPVPPADLIGATIPTVRQPPIAPIMPGVPTKQTYVPPSDQNGITAGEILGALLSGAIEGAAERRNAPRSTWADPARTPSQTTQVVPSGQAREIEARRQGDYDPANRYRGEIETNGDVRMRDVNGNVLRGNVDQDGSGRVRDSDGNAYQVRPR
jgi:tetratricopeptide (TPR) repeat protein